ncbi:MAG: hypothetical protein K2X29_15300 [Candidatus Obscuribacterales bacterium]|nr:hypothetical protein [Candidatus Obscuribacterales bacterium]
MFKRVKFYLGITLLILSAVLPLLGFWVARLDLHLAIKSTIIGLLTLGAPEVLIIASVALLGKDAFDLITGKIRAALHRIKPSGPVSKRRYTIGLVLFLLPLIPTYVMAYTPHLLPDDSPERLYINIAADLLFIVSLFVLGGDFWDKLTALFVYDAKAQFPRNSTDSAKT